MADGIVARTGLQVEDVERPDLEELVPQDARAVLDVGCGAGVFGAALKRRGVVRVVGIEKNPVTARRARERLDEVLELDLDTESLPFADASFDCIVYGDVLEHLVDPWALVAAQARLLAPGGCVVVSIPNVAHWQIVLALLRGRWDYTSAGPMDATHLRWFTRRTLEELLAQAGLRIVEDRSYLPHGKARLLDRLTRGQLRHLVVWRHVVGAVRAEER